MRVVVVHGHRRRGNPRISREAEHRVRTAAAYVRTHRTEYVIFSGRGLAGLGHYSEALQMRAVWWHFGFGADHEAAPIVESRSSSTAENAWEAGSLVLDRLPPGPFEIVVTTSWWHAPRAWFLWTRAWPGWKIRMQPSWGSVRYVPGELRAVFRLWRSWPR